MSKAEDKKGTPMDPSIRENSTPVARPVNERTCYAIKTLNEEVWRLFPDTPVVEYSNRNGRGVALDVTYDMSSMDAGDVYDFTALMPMIEGDPRVDSVIIGGSSVTAVLVSMRSDARTQDVRAPFGLAEAYLILSEDGTGSDEGFFGDTDPLDSTEHGAFSDPALHARMTATTDGGSASETTNDTMEGGGA